MTGIYNIKVDFEGNTNSNGSFVKIFWNDETSTNNLLYSAVDLSGVPGHHMFSFPKPAGKIWLEVRIYINPPVCGTGEFKFTSVRDLKINAVN